MPGMYKLSVAMLLIIVVGCSGSALFPSISVSSSENGNFVVTSETTLGRDLGGGAHEIESETFRVHKRIEIDNARDGFRTSAALWGTTWSFYINRGSNSWAMIGNFPLVSNDCETVVLINIEPAMSSTMAVLSIYRHAGVTGRLIRTVHLNELWTEQALASIPKVGMFTGASPQWFAGGTLNFSSDSQKLIHTTRWGNTIAIKLHSNGA
jgi:hypothetical protein